MTAADGVEQNLTVPIDWHKLEPTSPYAGIQLRRFNTEHATVVRYEFQPGATYPLHHHLEEQLIYVVRGSVNFQLGDQVITLGPDDMLHVPSNIPHGATAAGTEEAVFLNIAMPRRGN